MSKHLVPPQWLPLQDSSPLWKAAVEAQKNPIKFHKHPGKKLRPFTELELKGLTHDRV
jgi:hypothetical protein